MKYLTAGALFLVSVASLSAASRTFVASTGVDTNPCSLTAPCRSFAAAVVATDAGGEVLALDSAGYGPVAITTSLSLVAPAGVEAAITVPGLSTGIEVAAGSTDIVTIRGVALLTVSAFLTTLGVEVSSVGSLHLQNVNIQGIPYGITVFPTTDAAVHITDCVVTGTHFAGARFGNIGNNKFTHATVVNSRFEDDFSGLTVGDHAVVVVEKSVVSGNSNVGFFVDTGGDLTIDDSVSSDNAYGVSASGVARVARSLIVKNVGGVQQNSGGQLWSWGDNHLAANVVDGTFPFTLTKQ